MDSVVSWFLNNYENIIKNPLLFVVGSVILLVAAIIYLIGRSKDVELKNEEIKGLKDKILIFNPESLEKYYTITIKQMDKRINDLTVENGKIQYEQTELVSQIEKMKNEKKASENQIQELEEKLLKISEVNKKQERLLEKAEKEKQKTKITFDKSKELIDSFNTTTGSSSIGTASIYNAIDEDIYPLFSNQELEKQNRIELPIVHPPSLFQNEKGKDP